MIFQRYYERNFLDDINIWCVQYNKHKKKNCEEKINCRVILEWSTKSSQTPGELAKKVTLRAYAYVTQVFPKAEINILKEWGRAKKFQLTSLTH